MRKRVIMWFMGNNKFRSAGPIFNVLGSLIIVMGVLFLIPLIFSVFFEGLIYAKAFIIPSVLAVISGLFLKIIFPSGKIYFRMSLLLCGISWFVLCLFASLPFYFAAGKPLLDCYFETVSGFTTTGITIFTDIESLPASILLWRSLIQWFGGLGILTFFLAVTFKSNGAYYHLFGAEGHKIESSRPVPNVIRTVIILWSIYSLFTVLEVIILKILGLSLFDAVNHAFTSLSTGGFSTYDASIDYFRQAGYRNYKAIEYVITFFMLLGGINFLIHFKILTGRFKEAFRNIEFKYFIGIIFLVFIIIMGNRFVRLGISPVRNLEEESRKTIFTVVSIITTTGYGTEDINSSFFPALAKQVLLILMLVGGSVGSTAGGVKVMRIVILLKLFKEQLKRLRLPRNALSDIVIDGRIFPVTEIKRITGLFFGWLLLIAAGGFITALFTDLNSWQSFSGMFSAVGNIGPCYFSVQEMSDLPAVVKVTYIFGMLAGRLEILPVLFIFSPKAWRG